MSTFVAADHTPTSASASHRSLGSRARHALKALAIVIALAFGASVIATAPANAATNYATVSVCFRFAGGGPYTNTIYVQAYVNGTWSNIATTRSVNGCVNYPLIAGYYWRYLAQEIVGRTMWLGTSNWILPAAGRSYNLGTYYVTSRSW